MSVILTPLVAVITAAAYYPIRKRYLAGQDVDLDALTTDPSDSFLI
jgi:hypothetical protein